jgi:hypothetical protein
VQATRSGAFLSASCGRLRSETRAEIECEQIEQGSETEEDKQRRLAELRAAHEHRCGLHEARWAELQGKAGWL